MAGAAAVASPGLGSTLSRHYADCCATWPGAAQLPIVYSEVGVAGHRRAPQQTPCCQKVIRAVCKAASPLFWGRWR
jgi:hypothetical protein